MSYILDALRKSDEARRRTTSPLLDRVSAPHQAPRRRWSWMVAGAVLVAANLAVIAWVLRPGLGLSLPGVFSRPAPGTSVTDLSRPRDPDPPPPRPPAVSAPAITAPPAATALAPPAAPAATAPARTPPPVPAEPARTAASASPQVEPAPVFAKRGEAVKPAPPAPAAPRADERREPPPASPPPAPLSPAPTAPSAPATVSAPPTDVPLPAPLVRGPRAAESVAAPKPSGPQAGPAGDDILSKLKLTVHVYAENPPDRLVFINGTKYVQGDRIDGKALVEEITQDGAVVSFEGRRAVLRH